MRWYSKPGAAAGVPCFGSAGDVVRFAVESGWVLEEQIIGGELDGDGEGGQYHGGGRGRRQG